MADSNSASGGGVGIFTCMFLIFLTLKLCDVIQWSWWWVTAPLWGPLLVVIALLMIVGFVYLCVK
jgi:hypothetical protein